jgi:hypothetical protein
MVLSMPSTICLGPSKCHFDDCNETVVVSLEDRFSTTTVRGRKIDVAFVVVVETRKVRLEAAILCRTVVQIAIDVQKEQCSVTTSATNRSSPS